MIRCQLIARLAARFPQLSAKDAELVVKAILEGLSNTLASGERNRRRAIGPFTAMTGMKQAHTGKPDMSSSCCTMSSGLGYALNTEHRGRR